MKTFVEQVMQRPLRMRPAIAVLAMVIAVAADSAAQQEPARPPDIELIANVRIREIVFETEPIVSVTFAGGQDHINVWETQRRNLPEKVQPKVIYRDVGIILTITSTLPDIEKIVDEALADVAARRSQQ